MIDQNFLQHVVELYGLIHANKLSHIHDLNGEMLFVSDKFRKLIRKSSDSKAPYHDFDIARTPPESICSINASLNKAIQTREVQNCLSINLNRENPDYHVLQVVKSPIINPHTDNVVGVIVEFCKIDFPLYFHKIFQIQPKQISKTKVISSDELLTTREHEIAFLLFYCRNSDEIASTINTFNDKFITSKTIRNIIRQQLYPKLDVSNVEAALLCLRELGYHKKVPKSLLTNIYIDFADM